jgi:hypothetical protein
MSSQNLSSFKQQDSPIQDSPTESLPKDRPDFKDMKNAPSNIIPEMSE